MMPWKRDSKKKDSNQANESKESKESKNSKGKGKDKSELLSFLLIVVEKRPTFSIL